MTRMHIGDVRRLTPGPRTDPGRTPRELFNSDVSKVNDGIDHRTATLTSENGKGISAVADT